jgi:hypothetical protein
MHVTGPLPRELSSIITQLRHVYMLQAKNDKPEQVKLAKQIERLERVMREYLSPEGGVA